MLVIGLNGQGKSSSHGGAKGCLLEEYRSQMSLWCLLSAPLITSCDLRNMDEDIRSILTKKQVIAINQDPLGKQAEKVFEMNKIEYWRKPMSDGSVVIGILNRQNNPVEITLKWENIGLQGYQMVKDIWMNVSIGVLDKLMTVIIPAHDVQLIQFTSGY